MRQVLCPRLIGRDEEMLTLGTVLEAARTNRGGCVFVLGEAGVGKSRLVREADRMAQAQAMRTLWGRGVEGGASVAYRPIAEALLSGLRRDGPPTDRPELRPFQKILGRLIPEWREEAALPVDDSLVLLSEAVLRLLNALAGPNGLLLVLEDLHWADSETLAVLDYLAANATSEALVVLATSRSDESCAALEMARSFQTHRVGTVIEVQRLAPETVREMASACLDGSPVPEAVERLLNASADGLPLLVEDLLAEWVGAGALIKSEDRWRVHAVVGPVVPISFADTVRRRLRILGDDCTSLLRLAALLGRRFDWTLLPPASGLQDDRVLELLHAAVDAQLLLAEPSAFRFRHALTQAAVLEELLPAQRARQAARLLVLLESAHPQLEGDLCELAAALAVAAGNRPKAAQLLFDSGCTSLTRGALATAEATLEHAHALAPVPPDGELRVQIDESLLQVLSQAGKHERVFEVGESLLATLSTMSGAGLRAAVVHLEMASVAVAGSRLADASEHLTQARRLDRQGALTAQIDAQAAHVAIDAGRVDEAELLARTALEAAQGLGQTQVACEALVVLGRLARAYDLDRAEQAFERAHSLAESHGLTIWRCRALHELGTIDMFRDCSPRRLLQARELAVDSGALATAAAVDGELAALYALRFEIDLCVEAAQRALEAARRFRLPGVEVVGLFFTAEAHAFRLDRGALERTLAELPSLDGQDAFFNLCANQFRATVSLLEEDRKRALHELATAMAFAKQLAVAAPGPSFGMWALLKSLMDEDGTQIREGIRTSWAMSQPANRGLLAYAEAIDLGRHGHSDNAAAAMTEGDGVLANAPYYRHYGRRLVAEAAIVDAWGDPAGWLVEAQGFFEQHGYLAVSSACRSLLRKCAGGARTTPRPHRGVPEPFGSRGVTVREMEVLKILAEGVSNKDIGVRLYLSPKTVEKHVASLMDKLEVRSRAQLATLLTAHMGAAAPQNWGKSRLPARGDSGKVGA